MREEKQGNAILAANPTHFLDVWEKYPHSLLAASEEPVGLLEGQFGNSEIGHMTIGAGRKLPQDIDRIHNYLDNEIREDEKYLDLLKKIKSKSGRVHIMGLFSDGKVHSDKDHFLKLYEHLVEDGIKEIYFHLITDGRDTKTTSAYEYIKELEDKIKENKRGSIATICGRFYAMDRDDKLDRTKKYYDLITKGTGALIKNIENSLHTCYEKNVTDEFIPPLLIDQNGLIKDDDCLLWMNYRTDRAKQILASFTNLEYNSFPVVRYNNLDVYSFIPIDKKIETEYFLEETVVKNPLGLYLADLGLTQARIAETEKYAHVTYFFDGMYEGSIENCAKILVPSLNIKTYDLDPRMSVVEVAKKTIDCMEKDIDFVLVNFASPDMVGHTGNYEATIKAIMAVDVCLEKILEAATNNFYKVIITADHGNADTMLDEENNIVTTHSLAKVPFIILDENVKLKSEGDLTNIAPTILDYMDIKKTKEMKDTESLILK